MSERIAFPSSVKVQDGKIRRTYRIPAGQNLETHEHPYDHLAVLFSGVAILTTNGVKRHLRGPQFVTITKGIVHGVYAVTDCEWDCIHSLKDAQESGDEHILAGVKELI